MPPVLKVSCGAVALLPAASGASGAGFDCSDGMEETWSQPQRDVCCIIEGKGCSLLAKQMAQGEPTTTLAGTSMTIFDCSSRTDDWDEAKQDWCCQHWSIGCSGSAPTKGGDDDPDEGQDDDSQDQQRRPIIYDCKQDLDQWITKWDQSQQDWCCAHWGLGCSKPQGSSQNDMYECDQGLLNWEKGWSNAKKAYCCQHAAENVKAQLMDGDGCVTAMESSTTKVATPKCETIVFQHQDMTGWTANFRPGAYDNAAYVSAGAVGKAGAVAVNKFDKGCTAIIYERDDFTGWSVLLAPGFYSEEDIVKLGGSTSIFSIKVFASTLTTTVTTTSTTTSATSSSSTSTSTSTTAKITTTTLVYDCLEGYEDWRHNWSVPKKEHCCQKHGFCHATNTTTTSSSTATNTSTTKTLSTSTLSTTFMVECADTPGWTNGYGDCKREDKEQAECTPTGYTCEGYASQGFCSNGKVLQNFTAGNLYHHPELNCCACGGGYRPRKSDEPKVGCTEFKDWPDKVGVTDCGECKHVVSTKSHRTCSGYCQSLGMECFYAAEDHPAKPGSTDCPVKANATCSDDLAAMDVKSDNMICGCQDVRAAQYDCSPLDIDSWSDLKKSWCCFNEHKGCQKSTETTSLTSTSVTVTSASETSASTTSSSMTSRTTTKPTTSMTTTEVTAPFDCFRDLHGWRDTWSSEKKEYCCQNSHSCPKDEPDFDCFDDLGEWRDKWSSDKKNYCCNHAVSCPDENNREFDCFQDVDGRRERWSKQKREYCCEHEALCPPKEDFDCWADISMWEESWSKEQKEFCCGSRFKCPKEVHGLSRSGSADFPWDSSSNEYLCESLGNTSGNISAGREAARKWCCDNKDVGCREEIATHSSKSSRGAENFDRDTTIVEMLYDCEEDLNESTTRWTVAEYEWCCRTQNIGCLDDADLMRMFEGGHRDTTTDEMLYDCEEYLNESTTHWTVVKYEWCCHTQTIGCLDDADLMRKFEGGQFKLLATRRGRALRVALVLGLLSLVALMISLRLFTSRRQYHAVEPLLASHLRAHGEVVVEASGDEGTSVIQLE